MPYRTQILIYKGPRVYLYAMLSIQCTRLCLAPARLIFLSYFIYFCMRGDRSRMGDLSPCPSPSSPALPALPPEAGN